MSTALRRDEPERLRRQDVATLVRRLETGFVSIDAHYAPLMNQHLLDALDNNEHDRFLVWPGAHPRALLYLAANASAIPAGEAIAAPWLSAALERSGWRVLIGDVPLSESLLTTQSPPLFRRSPRVREQRFMVLERPRRRALSGMRVAGLRDLEVVTELACSLHEEDFMGPAISRSGRSTVRVRMMEAIARAAVWVVERDGVAIAKADLSLMSPRRGGQIAGVYVRPEFRNQGIATAAVGEIAAQLHAEGIPGVTLHVRADNAAAIAAYEAAGFTDVGALTLALR